MKGVPGAEADFEVALATMEVTFNDEAGVVEPAEGERALLVYLRPNEYLKFVLNDYQPISGGEGKAYLLVKMRSISGVPLFSLGYEEGKTAEGLVYPNGYYSLLTWPGAGWETLEIPVDESMFKSIPEGEGITAVVLPNWTGKEISFCLDEISLIWR
jgi:hypothetical protein